MTPPPPVTDPARARSILEAVLQRPEFQEHYRDLDLVSEIGRWVLSWIESFQSAMTHFGYTERLQRLSYILMWIILVGCIAAAIYWALKLGVTRRRDFLKRPLRPAGSLLPFKRGAVSDEAIAAAVRRGEWSHAASLRWRQFLDQLDSAGLIVLTPGLTNRECLRALAAPAGPLTEVVEEFDARVYGRSPFSESTWQAWASRLQSASLQLTSASARPRP